MMNVTISPSKYKDQKAISIETKSVKAQFLPEIGGKMASLVFKPRGLEMLIQRPGAKYALQPFDGDYVAGECSGLDDMFPTIDTCYYDRYPWSGVKMADHGEVWSLPWEMAIKDNSIYFSVHGVRFPYRLEKRISFSSENVLRWDYRLINMSNYDFEYVWAAHSMFNLEEGTELVLPVGVDQIQGTFSMPDGYVPYGEAFTFPTGSFANGNPRDFRWIQPKSAGIAYKYYIKGKMPEGWCGVKFHKSDFSLFMSWPVDQVPYLGILPNEGGWQNLYNIFLEPCTATFDRPDAARYRGEGSILKGKEEKQWHLNITLEEGIEWLRAGEDGKLEIKA